MDVARALQTQYRDVRTNAARFITQFGESIASPPGTEIGSLFRMNKLRKAADPQQYLLYIRADRP